MAAIYIVETNSMNPYKENGTYSMGLCDNFYYIYERNK